jgi:hypothetical protein
MKYVYPVLDDILPLCNAAFGDGGHENSQVGWLASLQYVLGGLEEKPDVQAQTFSGRRACLHGHSRFDGYGACSTHWLILGDERLLGLKCCAFKSCLRDALH